MCVCGFVFVLFLTTEYNIYISNKRRSINKIRKISKLLQRNVRVEFEIEEEEEEDEDEEEGMDSSFWTDPGTLYVFERFNTGTHTTTFTLLLLLFVFDVF